MKYPELLFKILRAFFVLLFIFSGSYSYYFGSILFIR